MIRSVQVTAFHAGQGYSQEQVELLPSSEHCNRTSTLEGIANMIHTILKGGVVLFLIPMVMGMTGCSKRHSGNDVEKSNQAESGYITLSPDRLPLAITGQSYQAQVTALTDNAGCTSSDYKWTQPSQLPPGIAYTIKPNDTLDIYGTPTTAGTYKFTVEVRDSGCGVGVHSEERTIVVADTIDLTGDWLFNITVTEAGSVCSSEVGYSSNDTITITQTNSGTPNVFNVTLDGFLNVPGNSVTGTLENGCTVDASGQYPEDGGTTTSHHYLTLYTPDEMSGEEQWSWSDGLDECLDGRATIVATRIVP